MKVKSKIDGILEYDIPLDASAVTAETIITKAYSEANFAQILATTSLAPVISILNSPPAHEEGNRYIIGLSPTGEWSGRTNQIAESISGIWSYTTPVINNTVYVTSTLTTLRFTNSGWITYAGTAVLHNGNSLGGQLFIGTNDANDVQIKVNNVHDIFRFGSDGRLSFNTSAFGFSNAGIWARSGTQPNIRVGSTTLILNAPANTGTLSLRANDSNLLQLVAGSGVNANRRVNMLNPTGSIVYATFSPSSESLGLGIGSELPQARLHVRESASANTTVLVQGIVNISGTTSGQTLLSVNGINGEVFRITDSTSGLLFGINDVSNMPVFETYSDYSIKLGNPNVPASITTRINIVNSGTTVLYTIPTTGQTGMFIDYTVNDGTNLRAGTIRSVWLNTIQSDQTQTADIGDTSGIALSIIISSGNVQVQSVCTTSNWTVKLIIRHI